MSDPNILTEAFQRAIDAFTASGARYALIGGFAVAYHGLPRPTRDVDFLYSVPTITIPRLLEAFQDRGFAFDREEVIRELTRNHLSAVHYRNVHVDLLDAIIPFFHRAIDGAREVEIERRTVRIVMAEDLIALKMIAARGDDLRDVRGILTAQRGRLNVDRIRRSLAECCPHDRIREFEILLAETGHHAQGEQ